MRHTPRRCNSLAGSCSVRTLQPDDTDTDRVHTVIADTSDSFKSPEPSDQCLRCPARRERDGEERESW